MSLSILRIIHQIATSKIFDVAIFTFLTIQRRTLHHCTYEVVVKNGGFHISTIQTYSPLSTRDSLNVQFLCQPLQCQHNFGLVKGSGSRPENAHVRAADGTSDWERRNVRSVSGSARREKSRSRGRQSTPPWLMSGLPGRWKLWPFEPQRAFSASSSHPGPPWAGNPDRTAVGVNLCHTEISNQPYLNRWFQQPSSNPRAPRSVSWWTESDPYS